MNIPGVHPAIDLSALSLDRFANQEGISHEAKVEELARQFEAVLLRQILKNIQKPVIESEFSLDSTSREIYQDMITVNLADSISRSGGLGLAKSLQAQLAHQTRADADQTQQP